MIKQNLVDLCNMLQKFLLNGREISLIAFVLIYPFDRDYKGGAYPSVVNLTNVIQGIYNDIIFILHNSCYVGQMYNLGVYAPA
jgi:hypothetical protein